jgi:hypothetical protein
MSFWERVRALSKIGHEPLGFLKTWVLFLKNEARATHKISVNLALPIPSRENALPVSVSFAPTEPGGEVFKAQARCGCVGLPTEFEHSVGAPYELGVWLRMGLRFRDILYPCS